MNERLNVPNSPEDQFKVIRFPGVEKASDARSSQDELGELDSTEHVLEAFSAVSRKIGDLARELKCLGYFEDDNQHRPRAA